MTLNARKILDSLGMDSAQQSWIDLGANRGEGRIFLE